MKKTLLVCAALLVALVSGLAAQEIKEYKAHPGVDQARVDKAISKGIQWLQGQSYSYGKPVNYEIESPRVDELVLYTLFHGGANPNSEVFQNLLKGILEIELDRTYSVSMQAMCLSEMDNRKYQWRVAHCCQFIVDNQCENGQWTYGRPTEIPKGIATGGNSEPDDVSSGPGGGRRRSRVKPLNQIDIKRQRKGENSGDNSNTQIAILGLRACLEAKVAPPAGTLMTAYKWWAESQNKDGGWGYKQAGTRPHSYGAMTAGGVGSLGILVHYLKRDWQRDPHIVKGIAWLGNNFSATEHPKFSGTRWRFYYLYGVERAGRLLDLDKFVKVDWYKEGANHLLDIQAEDGSWPNAEPDHGGGRTRDTCFAILFLGKCTPSLATHSAGRKK